MDLASRWMQMVANSTASVVVFLDWDDREIARVNVPRELKGEERLAYLNAYVRDNLIHPDLRRANLSSLKRKDSYRGKYPYVWEKKDDPAYIRKDGEKYPLTNKLDYKFVTGRQMPQPDGTVRIEDDPNDPYPYLRGFITVINTAAPPWTTFGTPGELSRFSHQFGDGRIAGFSDRGDNGLRYMQYPDGTVIYCNGWADLKQKGGGDSVTTKSDDAETVSLDDVPPMMLMSYEDGVQPVAEESDAVLPAADPDSAEMVEVPDDELERLYAIRDRWQAVADYSEAFRLEMGADTLNDAVMTATSEQLLEALKSIAAEVITLPERNIIWTVPESLAERVLSAEHRRTTAADMTAESEEV